MSNKIYDTVVEKIKKIYAMNIFSLVNILEKRYKKPLNVYFFYSF